MADRHGLSGVPPVDLADLAGPIARALVCAGGEEARARPGEVLLEDRDAAPVAERAQALPG
jgi:hypothetical protein